MKTRMQSSLSLATRSLATSLILIAALLIVGCEAAPTASEIAAADEPVYVDDPITAKRFGRTNGAVTIPFKAKFYTKGDVDLEDRSCGVPPPPIFLNTQEGAGKATHLGKFEIRITFCIDATDILDMQLTEGESLPYDRGVGTFTAANGDVLRFTIAGAVLPSDHPDFDFEFADPFEFTGGTGRFEGASGGGVTNSFVDQASARTEHQWSGTLTLPRGL